MAYPISQDWHAWSYTSPAGASGQVNMMKITAIQGRDCGILPSAVIMVITRNRESWTRRTAYPISQGVSGSDRYRAKFSRPFSSS
jgi:hypothetical protein